MFKLFCGPIVAVAFGGYTCADVEKNCMTGCSPHASCCNNGVNQCQCNYDGTRCREHEVCSCASVTQPTATSKHTIGCMTGCAPNGPYAHGVNQCQCNIDGTICGEGSFECPTPTVVSVNIDFLLLYSQDGKEHGSYEWSQEVTTGSSSTSNLYSSVTQESRSSVKVDKIVEEEVVAKHISEEQSTFMQSVATTASQASEFSQKTETWKVHFEMDKPAYLYQGRNTYQMSDNTEFTSSAKSYHVRSTVLELSSIRWPSGADELAALANSTLALRLPDVVIA